MWGDGSAVRSYTYVDDMVDGIFRLMHSDLEGAVNIGCPQYVTVRELVEIVAAVAGKKIVIKPVEGPVGSSPGISATGEFTRSAGAPALTSARASSGPILGSLSRSPLTAPGELWPDEDTGGVEQPDGLEVRLGRDALYAMQATFWMAQGHQTDFLLARPACSTAEAGSPPCRLIASDRLFDATNYLAKTWLYFPAYFWRMITSPLDAPAGALRPGLCDRPVRSRVLLGNGPGAAPAGEAGRQGPSCPAVSAGPPQRLGPLVPMGRAG